MMALTTSLSERPVLTMVLGRPTLCLGTLGCLVRLWICRRWCGARRGSGLLELMRETLLGIRWLVLEISMVMVWTMCALERRMPLAGLGGTRLISMSVRRTVCMV